MGERSEEHYVSIFHTVAFPAVSILTPAFCGPVGSVNRMAFITA
jgi:hypothetical protein